MQRNMRHRIDMRKIALPIVVALGLVACGQDDSAIIPQPRVMDPDVLARGIKLYRANCARCHGDNAEGASNWQQADKTGKYPPPPLNGNGHAWHHPTKVLLRTIKEGTVVIGGSMPPWQDKLSEEEMRAIIAWFQSRWPDELYAAWAQTDAKARAAK